MAMPEVLKPTVSAHIGSGCAYAVTACALQATEEHSRTGDSKTGRMNAIISTLIPRTVFEMNQNI
jgi:hypothetical protein